MGKIRKTGKEVTREYLEDLKNLTIKSFSDESFTDAESDFIFALSNISVVGSGVTLGYFRDTINKLIDERIEKNKQ